MVTLRRLCRLLLTLKKALWSSLVKFAPSLGILLKLSTIGFQTLPILKKLLRSGLWFVMNPLKTRLKFWRKSQKTPLPRQPLPSKGLLLRYYYLTKYSKSDTNLFLVKFGMYMKKNRDIITAIISAVSAVICALLAGCKLMVSEFTLKDLSMSLEVPNNIENTQE